MFFNVCKSERTGISWQCISLHYHMIGGSNGYWRGCLVDVVQQDVLDTTGSPKFQPLCVFCNRMTGKDWHKICRFGPIWRKSSFNSPDVCSVKTIYSNDVFMAACPYPCPCMSMRLCGNFRRPCSVFAWRCPCRHASHLWVETGFKTSTVTPPNPASEATSSSSKRHSLSNVMQNANVSSTNRKCKKSLRPSSSENNL